jgi:hypothetical protein
LEEWVFSLQKRRNLKITPKDIIPLKVWFQALSATADCSKNTSKVIENQGIFEADD